jgi:malonyl-CoA/methylmalonyl-CoA synthetase
MSALVDRLLGHGHDDQIAVVAEDAPAGLGYAALRARVQERATALRAGRPTLGGAPVPFLMPPGAAYVEALLATLAAGGTAVPLSPLHTPVELAHLLEQTGAPAVLCDPALARRLPPGTPLWGPSVAAAAQAAAAPPPADADDAVMLFTSGTTGRPKGVVSSHAAVAATLAALEQAWGWRRADRLLHVLPLHHTHGVIVALLGALWAGATVELRPFEAAATWQRLGQATVFMAVPTIYGRLLEAFARAEAEEQRCWRAAAEQLRLVTSGSAALPARAFAGFEAATGQRILERYGMTEIGMALSNPLGGPRLPGTVGRELPGVHVDIVAEDGRACAEGEPGELRVRSPQMFTRYHGDPGATAASFDRQGRFRTGDTGVREPGGHVRLLGRTSTDVLKSGGYKLSALEIEEALRDHPAIAEIAVIGLPDEVWGDRVTACVVVHPGQTLALEDLQAFARARLAPYKLPRALRLLAALPRNAMGKVQKGTLKHLCQAPD